MALSADAVEIVVPTRLWKGPVFSTNTTATSFATIGPTTTRPETNATTGVAILPAEYSVLKLCFFGTDAANETFDLKIVGWSRLQAAIAGSKNLNTEYIPTALAHLTVTLGATTGAAGGNTPNGTSDLYADLIAEASSGYSTSAVNYVSTDDGVPALVEVSHGGCEWIGLYFDMTGAASANALHMFT